MLSTSPHLQSTDSTNREDDVNWPKKNIVGKQELEIRVGNDHISFETAKIGSLVDIQDSEDPEGLRVFYYLVQDLKVSLIQRGVFVPGGGTRESSWLCAALCQLFFRFPCHQRVTARVFSMLLSSRPVSDDEIRSASSSLSSPFTSKSSPSKRGALHPVWTFLDHDQWII